jgi:hypothetical protein
VRFVRWWWLVPIFFSVTLDLLSFGFAANHFAPTICIIA